MKRKPIVPRAVAVADIDEIIEHYVEEAPAGVATRFVDALEEAFDRISRHPASGSPRYAHELDVPGLRCVQVSGFPHLVFYVEHADRIDVWRVLHGTRDVPSWMSGGD